MDGWLARNARASILPSDFIRPPSQRVQGGAMVSGMPTIPLRLEMANCLSTDCLKLLIDPRAAQLLFHVDHPLPLLSLDL